MQDIIGISKTINQKKKQSTLQDTLGFYSTLLGGWFAMGAYLYTLFGGFTEKPAVLNTLSIGLAFGVALVILRTLIGTRPIQWHVTPRSWIHLLINSTLGIMWAILIWAAYHRAILERQLALADWAVFLVGGLGLSFGFIVVRLFNRWAGWARLLIHATTIFVPVYFTAQQTVDRGVPALLYFEYHQQALITSLLFAVLIASGVHWQALWIDAKKQVR